MRYYNSTKKSYTPFIDDEPLIVDDNSGDKRDTKINCIRFFVGNVTSKTKGDSFIVKHTDSITNISNDWFTCKLDRTVAGFTTFTSVTPKRKESINITPSIISGSYSYDGESENFKIPLLSPIFANDNIKCSMSGKSSTKNVISINPNEGIIDVTRKV